MKKYLPLLVIAVGVLWMFGASSGKEYPKPKVEPKGRGGPAVNPPVAGDKGERGGTGGTTGENNDPGQGRPAVPGIDYDPLAGDKAERAN